MSKTTNDPMSIDVRIPIRSYLKKFVASHANVEPFTVSLTRCHFSCIFIEPLEKTQPKAGFKDKDLLNDSLTLKMGPSVMRENRFWWTPEIIMSIDYRLKAMFDQQLIDFITIANRKRGDIKQSIFDFMDYYGITDDDVKWDTLVKMYYRARYSSTESRRQKMEEVIAQHTIQFPN